MNRVSLSQVRRGSRPTLLVVGATLFMLHGYLTNQTSMAQELPNFVIVLADDLTYRDLGCYGGQADTPNIDRLAKEGMRLTRCFQAAAMCSPTRHNLYTGVYPVKSGAYPNHTFVKPGVLSLPQFLKPYGYRVALSGKTHIGPRSAFPFEYSGKKNPDMGRIDALVAESKRDDQPFCLVACSNEPHQPWDKGDPSRYPTEKIQLPPYIVDTPKVREDFSKYLAEITYFDQQVGDIVDILKRHHVEESTLIIVLSEQGNAFPFAKWTCYGNGLQSALVARWPGRIEPGTESAALVEYVDVLPTLLALVDETEAGSAKKGRSRKQLEGRSFWGVLEGTSDEHKDYVFGQMTTRGIIDGSDEYAIRTVRDARYRLIWNLNYDVPFSNVCVTSDYFDSMKAKAASGDATANTLTSRYIHRPEYELFDCETDPLEMANLADSEAHQDVLARLKTELVAWMENQGDQGVATERDAIFRLQRSRNKPREQVLREWEQRSARTKR